MDTLKCYYWEDYIKVEKESLIYYEVTDDNYIKIIRYPLKLNKKNVYQFVYDNDNTNIIQDISQSKRDIPRYCGYIEAGNKLIHFINGMYTYGYFKQLLEKYYTQKQIIDILNFCPQQIFIIILEEILKKYEGCFITKTTHQLIVKKESVERILEGSLMKDEIIIKKFTSRIKMKYDSDYIKLYVNYY